MYAIERKCKLFLVRTFTDLDVYFWRNQCCTNRIYRYYTSHKKLRARQKMHSQTQTT